VSGTGAYGYLIVPVTTTEVAPVPAGNGEPRIEVSAPVIGSRVYAENVP